MGWHVLVYVIPPFLFVLTMIVFFHELGHFLVARWCGVSVKAFSLGFGREIAGFTDRHGTRWKFSILPLGGYVQFMDDDNATSVPTGNQYEDGARDHDPGRFHTKPLWQRAAVVAAGPIANFLLAIVIFAGVYMAVGERTRAARVDSVVENSAAAEAGFKPGDVILSIDGETVSRFRDLVRIVTAAADRELTFQVERDGQPIVLKATPRRQEIVDRFRNKYKQGRLGVGQTANASERELKSVGPIRAIRLGAEDTYYFTGRTLGFIRDLFLGKEDIKQLGGPIRIAKVSGDFATLGFQALIQIVAVLSISIGLLNLFPVPMLDGGHLLFYGIEAIRGQPLSEKAQEVGFRIGLTMVIMLMIFTTSMDLTQIPEWIQNWLS
ncbi:MAG: RIP metalloprotease RseP [Hyphomicrobiaceae bacterium]